MRRDKEKHSLGNIYSTLFVDHQTSKQSQINLLIDVVSVFTSLQIYRSEEKDRLKVFLHGSTRFV